MSETIMDQEAPSLLPPESNPPPPEAAPEPSEFVKSALATVSPELRSRLEKNDRFMRVKDIEDFSQSWDHAQATIGKLKTDRFIEKPSKTSTAEQWAEFYKAAGMPESPDGYEIELPEGSDPEKIAALYPKFHEWGLSSKQAQAAVSYMIEAGLSAQQAQASQVEEESRARRNEVLDKMKLAYGPNYETYVGYAQGEVAKVVKDDPNMTEELKARYERDPVVLKLVVDLTKHNAPDRLRVADGGGTEQKASVDSLETQLSELRKELGAKGYEGHQYARDPRVVALKNQIREMRKA